MSLFTNEHKYFVSPVLLAELRTEILRLREALREISHVEFRSTEDMQQFARDSLGDGSHRNCQRTCCREVPHD